MGQGMIRFNLCYKNGSTGAPFHCIWRPLTCCQLGCQLHTSRSCCSTMTPLQKTTFGPQPQTFRGFIAKTWRCKQSISAELCSHLPADGGSSSVMTQTERGHWVHWLLSGRPTGTAHRALQFAGHLVWGSETAGGTERRHKPSAARPSLLNLYHTCMHASSPSLSPFSHT